MIIFPFGFFILGDTSPIYIGNDIEAQKTVLTWMRLNPDKVLMRSDFVGSTEIVTRFLGWDENGGSATMRQSPLLFKTTSTAEGVVVSHRLYSDFEAAIEGHDDLVQLAKSHLN
jgi:hypothetical protein